jgi:oligopeptide/dipeptide ABC transporter ATP-binding protein
MTCLAAIGLLPKEARVTSGRIAFKGEDLLSKSERELGRLRGHGIGMVLQDPMTSLNPLFTAGNQIAEVFRYRDGIRSSRERWRRAIDILRAVKIPAAAERAGAYPHQLSGGMKQRVAIGINIAAAPDLLIADEPTTALDATVGAHILTLLKEIQKERGTAIILVTHDLVQVARFCDDIAVMYAGTVVETGPALEILRTPRHPYTAALIAAVPKIRAGVDRLAAIPGQPPRLADWVSGCRFAPRCQASTERCLKIEPRLSGLGSQAQAVACFHPVRQAA